MRQIPNSYSYKDSWMVDHSDSVKVLALGSSNMYAAFNPRLVTNSFNLANSFQRLEYDYYLLNRYSTKLRNLSVVVLGVDYVNISFPQHSVDVYDRHRTVSYKLYMGYPKGSSLSINNYEFSCNKTFLRKVELCFQHLLGKQVDMSCDSLGHATYYKLNNKSASDMSDSYGKKVLGITDFSDSNVLSNFVYIGKIAELCEKTNAHLVIVSTPVWSTMRNQFIPDNLNKFRNLLNAVIEEYPNISYYDLTDDPHYTFDDYYDANHLSEYGALKFSKQIASFVTDDCYN